MSVPASPDIKAEADSNEHSHRSVRPSAPVGASTCRDIHISEQGQHLAPSGPTRIATWRPIPGKSSPKSEFKPTPEQEIKMEELKQYTEATLMLDPSHEYYFWEKKWLDRKDTYSRYMRAADWKMENAKKRIKDTLEWRRSYKPDLISPAEIRVEAEGGKVVVNGFDRDGRPIVWLRPSRENTKPSPTQLRHLIFQLERAIDLMPEGVEKLALVVDYKGATSANNPSMKTVKEVIHILQNHYVERLGKGVVVHVPFYLQAFFNMIKPLLDPKTKAKVEFNPKLESLIPNQQLDSEFGGDVNYVYDANVYLPALCHFCGVKEDGTREDIIPKDVPAAKPDEIQRTLTSQTGDTAERDAEYARREAEAQERQDREAREFAEKGRQMQFNEEEDTSHPPTDLENSAQADAITATNDQDRRIVSTDPVGHRSATVGDDVIAAAAAASIAAAMKAGQSGGQSNLPVQVATQGAGAASAHNTSSNHDSSSGQAAYINDREIAEKRDHENSLSTRDQHGSALQDASPSAQASRLATPTRDTHDTNRPDANGPSVHRATSKHDLSEGKTNQTMEPGVAETQEHEKSSERNPRTPAAHRASPPAPSPKPAVPPVKSDEAVDGPKSKVLLPNSHNKETGRKRGGWKLFSSKRGLDKDGNPTQHKHKHISKAFCMHKGAVDPSKDSSSKDASGKSSSLAPNGPTDTSDNAKSNRIKIAPEATEGREERTYNNAPLATNATFGPDGYHTAMEAYPTTAGDTDGEGDYFTNMRKMPPIKPTNVEQEEKDQAKLVERPTEILNRLHEGGTGDLVLAFEVKQPPIEPEVDLKAGDETAPDDANATAEAATKGEKAVRV